MSVVNLDMNWFILELCFVFIWSASLDDRLSLHDGWCSGNTQAVHNQPHSGPHQTWLLQQHCCQWTFSRQSVQNCEYISPKQRWLDQEGLSNWRLVVVVHMEKRIIGTSTDPLQTLALTDTTLGACSLTRAVVTSSLNTWSYGQCQYYWCHCCLPSFRSCPTVLPLWWSDSRETARNIKVEPHLKWNHFLLSLYQGNNNNSCIVLNWCQWQH